MCSPTRDKGFVTFTFAPHKGGDVTRLGLENDGMALALAFITVGRIHAVLDMLRQSLARGFIKPSIFIEGDLKFAIDQAKDGAINDGLAKFFYQVQFKRWLARPIGVNKASIGVKACQDQGTLDPSIEDAIAIVQCGIQRVSGSLSLAPGPVKIGEQEAAHTGPVTFCSTTLGGQQLQPDLVAGIADNGLGCLERVTNFADDALCFLEAVRIIFAPILGHSP